MKLVQPIRDGKKIITIQEIDNETINKQERQNKKILSVTMIVISLVIIVNALKFHSENISTHEQVNIAQKTMIEHENWSLIPSKVSQSDLLPSKTPQEYAQLEILKKKE